MTGRLSHCIGVSIDDVLQRGYDNVAEAQHY